MRHQFLGGRWAAGAATVEPQTAVVFDLQSPIGETSHSVHLPLSASQTAASCAYSLVGSASRKASIFNALA